jgi:hypothetical protein
VLVSHTATTIKIQDNKKYQPLPFRLHNNEERVQATFCSGAPDGSAYDTNVDAGVDSAVNTMDISGDSQIMNADAIGQLGIHTGQFNSIVIR